ncbi:MAG: hypothetical protein EBW05_13085 [Betaproteobacteria bacterium]|nr:hypothetical protein [Betaproteobacteria bacterium]
MAQARASDRLTAQLNPQNETTQSLISLRSIEHGGEKLHGHAAILVDQTSHWTGFLIGCTIAIINHFFLETDGGQVPS